jgi:hypothetical protein
MVRLVGYNLRTCKAARSPNRSQLKNVQKKLGCPRTSLGSLSEATQVLDPEPVKQIAAELAGQLEPFANDRRCPEVKHLVTAVDGTVVRTLSRIVEAAFPGSARQGVPRRIGADRGRTRPPREA